jgi:transcriptional regulator with XRE-family HTH domain
MDELYRLFGEAVHLSRRRAHMTQEDLANRVRLTRTSITNIEKGKQNVSIRMLYDLAAALKKRPEELLPPLEELSMDAIKQKKLEEIELTARNRELVDRLLVHSAKVRGELKK